MDFKTAADTVKNIANRPADAKLLEAYGLFKQASVGDNSTSQPWAVQVQARAKWEAWTKNKGMSTADAEAAYIKLATELSEWDAAQ